MEKGTGKRIIAITGPESTGKTTLSLALAKYFGTEAGVEYARLFLDHLDRSYTLSDLEEIARGQLNLEKHLLIEKSETIILDTDLLVIFLWAKIKYQHHFGWMESALRRQNDRLYLLCSPDIPWEHDPLRENPNDRDDIFESYRKEMNRLGLCYRIVSGMGSERLDNALQAIENWK